MSTESYTFPESIEHPAQTIQRDQRPGWRPFTAQSCNSPRQCCGPNGTTCPECGTQNWREFHGMADGECGTCGFEG